MTFRSGVPRVRGGPKLPALGRMRTFTTWSLIGIVVLYMIGVAAAARTPVVRDGVLVVGLFTAWQAAYWENGVGVAKAGAIASTSYALWWVAVLHHDTEYAVTGFALSAGLVTTSPRFLGWRWSCLATVLSAVPPLAVLGVDLRGVAAAVAGGVLTGAAIATFRMNRFAFGLYLEIDRARAVESELAVVRERYRFAADLHDIQGQALHVSRLQLRIAERLLETRPAEARHHLRKTEELLTDALSATRGLVYGTHVLTLAGELANSASLMEAAAIRVEIHGTPPVGHRHDKLLALLVRETTTNLLRHAQAGKVEITFGPDSVEIANDGASSPPGPLSGLARLAERFAAEGGTLSTEQRGPVFITRAAVAS